MGQIVTWTCTLALVIVVPKHLGDDNYGKLALALFLVNMLALVTDLGSSAFMTREIARRENSDDLPDYAFNGVFLRLPLALLACIIGVVAINLLGYDGTTRTVFYLLLPVIPLQALMQILNSTLIGVQRMQPLAFIGAFTRVIHTVAIIIILKMGYGLSEVAALATLPVALAVLFVAYYVVRYVGVRPRLSLAICKAIILGGLPFLIWQASLFLYGQIDVLQLSLMTRDAEVGWYAAAYQIILIPAFLPTIVITALYPILSTLAQSDRAQFAIIARRSLQLIVLMIMPLALGTALLAPAIIHFFGYPEEFKHAVPLITILALHVPSAAATTLIGTYLVALDRQHRWALVGLAAAVINPTINLALIPVTSHAFNNGAIGAAITTDITEYFMLFCGLMLIPKGILSWDELKHAARCLVAGGIMAGIVWLIGAGNPVPAVAAGAVVYLLGSLALGTINVREAREALAYVMAGRGKPIPAASDVPVASASTGH